MSAHTPGPWVLHTPDNYTPWIGSKTGPQTLGGIICEAPVRYTSSMNDWEANARLIAAAPDLLSALVKLRDWYTVYTGLPACEANAAIAKAEGRAE